MGRHGDGFLRGWNDMTSEQQQLLLRIQDETDCGLPNEILTALGNADASKQDKAAVRKFLGS